MGLFKGDEFAPDFPQKIIITNKKWGSFQKKSHSTIRPGADPVSGATSKWPTPISMRTHSSSEQKKSNPNPKSTKKFPKGKG